jgi:hypothetical protein
MPSRQIRFPWRASLLATAALVALSAGGSAKDLPATPEGAEKLNAFFATYLGKPAAGAPTTLVVTPEGSDYAVSLDLAALMAPFSAAGLSYDSATFKYKLVEQDDGAWRVENSGFPPILAHMKDGESTISIAGYKGQFVIDPAIAWWRSGSGSADKVNVKTHVTSVHGAGVDETIDTGALQVTASSQATSEGSVSSVMRESIADLVAAFSVTPGAAEAGPDAKPVNIVAHFDKAIFDATLDGLRSRAALDLWAFLVAHPSRSDLAANEAALKTLLTNALASQLKLDENIALQRIAVQIPQGAVAMDAAKIGFGGATGAAGAFEEHFSVDGLALPPGLVPPMYRDLVPTSVDVGFKASGFDFAAASAEAIADMHLAGDAEPISGEDRAKVWAKLIGAGPVLVDVPPSRLVAPQLDIAFEGQVRYQGAKPSGSFTAHMRNFEKTQAALKGLGPEAEKKVVPFLAMAKGLAKTESDGALTWVGELGADGMMKVNGLPLGKAPL